MAERSTPPAQSFRLRGTESCIIQLNAAAGSTLTVNKTLRVFALVWIVLLAIPNAVVLVIVLLSAKRDGWPVSVVLVFLFCLLLVDAVLSTPALAAEWFRSIRIARARLRILRKYQLPESRA